MTQGFVKNRKFRGLMAVDWWDRAGEVFQHNHPGIEFQKRDLFQRSEIAEVCDQLRLKCDVLLGGPPCQGFSTLGIRRENDRRSHLVDTFLDMALEISPKVIIMENVRGITSKIHSSGASFADFASSRLANGHPKSGYNSRNILINTLDFGLAQTRKRWILLAVRIDVDNDGQVLDCLVQQIESRKSKKHKTIRDVMGDLPMVDCGQGAEELTYTVASTGVMKTVYNHRPMDHKPALRERLSHVRPGRGLPDVPRHLLTEHLKRMLDGKYGNGGHIKNIYGRMEWDQPSGTVVAGIDKITCGRFIHPEFNRLLTPRECARIQSFSDEFRFFGSLVSQYYLIGNAVPPKLAGVIAKSVQAALET
ncbi:DNA cytosine methyltransferase [SAR202 cluster bacterium AC-647-N09_OGT_505m]|nr:DNA cytosine methyltransferase [SAR202 cluster bacterium AC-647-N09_OGT_505m]